MTELLIEPMCNVVESDLVRAANRLLTRFSLVSPSTSLLIQAELASSGRDRSEVSFWSEAWQSGEREVDAHVARGEITVFDDVDSFLAHLSEIAPAE